MGGILLAVALLGAPHTLSAKLADGDLVFHVSRSRQGKAVSAATGSRYTHMGLVFFDDGHPVVYEAVEPVRITPLAKWVARGEDGHVVVMRLKTPPAPEQARRLRAAANARLGLHYDLHFDWSDARLYCSEYAWKVYAEGMGVELGQPQKWSELDLGDEVVRRLARKRLGHLPDPDALVLTPVQMMRSPLLVEVARVR